MVKQVTWRANILVLMMYVMANSAAFAGDIEHGKVIYQSCMACHSIDENDVGPMHRGIVGRVAGTIPDYSYSTALKKSGLVWTTEALNRWLTNPQALVPGSKMMFSLSNTKDRLDVIAYLETLK